MKKILAVIAAMMLAVPSFAQFASGGFELDKQNLYYGARMGLNLGSMSGDIQTDGLKAGLNLAGVVGLRLSTTSPVFLESGLYFTQRGGKKNGYTLNLNYLEVPILVKYGIQATDDIAVLPFVGPYFSYGIGGKRKGHGDSWSAYNDVNHGDMGFKVGCGAEYNLLYLELGYQFGVANIADSGDDSIHGNALFINFGVNF